MPITDPAAAARAATDLPMLDAAIADCSPARASSRGARRRPASRSPASATRPTGRGRSRATATRGARILIVGLAPAAHGGNRTGRVFTGDESGEFLWRALHAQGLSDRAVSRRAGRRPHAPRPAHRRRRPVRAARQQADARRAAHLPPVPRPRAPAAPRAAGHPRRSGAIGWDAALRSLAALGLRDAPAPGRASATARRRGSARTRCSAATTRASRTRSPAGSPSRCSSRCSRAPASWRGSLRPEAYGCAMTVKVPSKGTRGTAFPQAMARLSSRFVGWMYRHGDRPVCRRHPDAPPRDPRGEVRASARSAPRVLRRAARRWLIVASMSGTSWNPAWLHNLAKQPGRDDRARRRRRGSRSGRRCPKARTWTRPGGASGPMPTSTPTTGPRRIARSPSSVSADARTRRPARARTSRTLVGP